MTDQSFAVHSGIPRDRDHHYANLPGWVLQYLPKWKRRDGTGNGLTPSDFALLLQLSRFDFDRDGCAEDIYVSTLVEALSVDRATIYRYLKAAKSAGWLVIESGKKTGTTNLYDYSALVSFCFERAGEDGWFNRRTLVAYEGGVSQPCDTGYRNPATPLSNIKESSSGDQSPRKKKPQKTPPQQPQWTPIDEETVREIERDNPLMAWIQVKPFIDRDQFLETTQPPAGCTYMRMGGDKAKRVMAKLDDNNYYTLVDGASWLAYYEYGLTLALENPKNHVKAKAIFDQIHNVWRGKIRADEDKAYTLRTLPVRLLMAFVQFRIDEDKIPPLRSSLGLIAALVAFEENNADEVPDIAPPPATVVRIKSPLGTVFSFDNPNDPNIDALLAQGGKRL